MYVLCKTCKNHYDDDCQSPDCAGIGGAAKTSSFDRGTSHEEVRAKAVDVHIYNVQEANRLHREPVAVTPAGRTRLAAVPTDDAAPSDA